MSFINFVKSEVEFKIVYYGCALGGKTSSIGYVHERVDAQDRGNLVLLPTQNDRTLFFDFLPITGGKVKGFNVRFKLWTVPGQVMYNATRQLVLRGVDGLIFVVDSQWDRMEANLESLRNLEENLTGMDLNLDRLAWAFFYNKRDLSEEQIAPVDAIDLLLKAPVRRVPRLAGDCVTGRNVFGALNFVTQKVLRDFMLKDDLENYEAYR
ncbi:MAG: gliding-motility protein MglA [Verrucomicrobia bacterium]|nr:gliding-motility protein MglA [Verrucomicrobiota bacterium]